MFAQKIRRKPASFAPRLLFHTYRSQEPGDTMFSRLFYDLLASGEWWDSILDDSYRCARHSMVLPSPFPRFWKHTLHLRAMLVAYLFTTSLCQSARLSKLSAPRAPPARLELGWDEAEYDDRYSDDDEMDAVQGTWTEDAELILGADMLLSTSAEDDMDELQSLVGEWQEQQALADESGGPTTASQQAATMALRNLNPNPSLNPVRNPELRP